MSSLFKEYLYIRSLYNNYVHSKILGLSQERKRGNNILAFIIFLDTHLFRCNCLKYMYVRAAQCNMG